MLNALDDEELVDCAGDEIGRLLAAFSGRPYATGPVLDALPPFVLFGLTTASHAAYRYLRPLRPDPQAR